MQTKEKKQLGENFGLWKEYVIRFANIKQILENNGAKSRKVEENFYMIWLTNLIRSMSTGATPLHHLSY